MGFLSRLCGGEAVALLKERGNYFLSRLCGGEGLPIICSGLAFFLSRLCGGEDYQFLHCQKFYCF